MLSAEPETTTTKVLAGVIGDGLTCSRCDCYVRPGDGNLRGWTIAILTDGEIEAWCRECKEAANGY